MLVPPTKPSVNHMSSTSVTFARYSHSLWQEVALTFSSQHSLSSPPKPTYVSSAFTENSQWLKVTGVKKKEKCHWGKAKGHWQKTKSHWGKKVIWEKWSHWGKAKSHWIKAKHHWGTVKSHWGKVKSHWGKAKTCWSKAKSHWEKVLSHWGKEKSHWGKIKSLG